MKATMLSLVVTAALVGSLSAASTGVGAAPGSRIVDQTIACSMLGVGSPDVVRFMTASATPFQPASGAPPSLAAGNSGAAGASVGVIVRSRAGGGSPTGQVSITRTSGTRCLQTKLRAPLSTVGLKSGPAEPFGATYTCEVPEKVLIRVRAVFERPTSFSIDPRNRNQMIAKGRVATATVVVSTVRGLKPIVLGSVNDATGKARMFVARSRCMVG